MTEGTLSGYNPLTYYVNNVERLDRDVVNAFKKNDQTKMAELAAIDRKSFDVFICVNSSWHGFVLLVPSVDNMDGSAPLNMFSEKQLTDPFEIPTLLFCYKCELCFENANIRTYTIDFKMVQFKDIQRSIKKSYYISRFNIGPKGVQLAAMRAAPHHYNVILNDCVEFSKELCIQLLAFSDNWKQIEETVHTQIQKATASGFSIERLSRNNQSSGYLGNSLIGGTDVSSYVNDRTNLLWVFLLLIYPIIVAIVFKYFL